MIILAWNIRGLGSRAKRRELRNLIRISKVDYLIILETKAESLSPTSLRNIGGGRLNRWLVLPSRGSSGGILLGWNDSLASQLDIHLGAFSLSVKLQNKDDSFVWWLTGVYGLCLALDETLFFNELRYIKSLV